MSRSVEEHAASLAARVNPVDEHGRLRNVTREEYAALLADYGTIRPDATPLEKAHMALCQLLLGHDHYGSPMPDDNATLLARVAWEGTRQAIVESGGSKWLGL